MTVPDEKPFTYTGAEWLPVAKVLGGCNKKAKRDLEAIARDYLQMPQPHDERAAWKDWIAVQEAIYMSANDLQFDLEKANVDWNCGGIEGLSLQQELADICHFMEEYLRVASEDPEIFGEEAPPKGRENRARKWYQMALCRYWFETLGRKERVTIDPLSGKAAETPLVCFLIAASNPVLQDKPLTRESAAHAYRAYNKRSKFEEQFLDPWD